MASLLLLGCSTVGSAGCLLLPLCQRGSRLLAGFVRGFRCCFVPTSETKTQGK